MQETDIGNGGRVFVGALAGALAIANKIASQGASGVKEVLKTIRSDDEWIMTASGYLAVAFCGIALSAGIAWAVTERNRLKLMAIAVSAPALVSTWTVGEKPKSLAFVGTAYAQSTGSNSASGESAFWRGVRLYFNGASTAVVGASDAAAYRVVAASARTPDEAASLADLLKRQAPDLPIAVADQAAGNPYFAVIASDFLPYNDAVKVLARIKTTPAGAKAYLSAEAPNSPGLLK